MEQENPTWMQGATVDNTTGKTGVDIVAETTDMSSESAERYDPDLQRELNRQEALKAGRRDVSSTPTTPNEGNAQLPEAGAWKPSGGRR